MVIVTSDNTVNLAEILHWSSCNDTQHYCHPTDSYLVCYRIQTTGTQLVAKQCYRWLCLLTFRQCDSGPYHPW